MFALNFVVSTILDIYFSLNKNKIRTRISSVRSAIYAI